MFEKAIRAKLRFDTQRGQIGIEDLWDLPLTGKVSLDTIAIELRKQLRETAATVSFVRPASAITTDLQLKFDVVKHILDTRVAERDAAQMESDRASKKQHLLEILARKQTAELEGKTSEELINMINSL